MQRLVRGILSGVARKQSATPVWRILALSAAASFLTALAIVGGTWGHVAGQTAGPPPTAAPANAPPPGALITPPNADAFRPNPTARPAPLPGTSAQGTGFLWILLLGAAVAGALIWYVRRR